MLSTYGSTVVRQTVNSFDSKNPLFMFWNEGDVSGSGQTTLFVNIERTRPHKFSIL